MLGALYVVISEKSVPELDDIFATIEIAVKAGHLRAPTENSILLGHHYPSFEENVVDGPFLIDVAKELIAAFPNLGESGSVVVTKEGAGFRGETLVLTVIRNQGKYRILQMQNADGDSSFRIGPVIYESGQRVQEKSMAKKKWWQIWK